MSGGHFEYKQYQIDEIATQIEHEIKINGKPKTKQELDDEGWPDDNWYAKDPKDLINYEYPKEVIIEFKNAAKHLRIAAVYAQRIDWLLSGDDGNETFLERLKEDLSKL